MCVMHGEDNDIVMHMYDKLIREGRTGFENMAEVHNAMSEDLSFRRVLGLAKNVPGIVLYFMHVSAGFGVEAIREARARGLPVYGETLLQGSIPAQAQEQAGTLYQTQIGTSQDAIDLLSAVQFTDVQVGRL